MVESHTKRAIRGDYVGIGRVVHQVASPRFPFDPVIGGPVLGGNPGHRFGILCQVAMALGMAIMFGVML